MNHALKAAIALVMGAGLAVSAQAHGINMHRSAAMSQRPAQMGQRQTPMKLSKQQVKTAQRRLKADGLYKGHIDGIDGAKTRRAIALFQQRNGLQRTAKLNRRTFDRLTGNQAVGVGSSRPAPNTMMNRNANANGNGSGSSVNNTTPMVPPANNLNNNGAGNSLAPNNQNPANGK